MADPCKQCGKHPQLTGTFAYYGMCDECTKERSRQVAKEHFKDDSMFIEAAAWFGMACIILPAYALVMAIDHALRLYGRIRRLFED